MSAFLVILSRWLHLTAAGLLVGGVFYARIVLPIAVRAGGNDPAVRSVLLLGRRVFKITVHACVLFLLLSGTYNYVLNRPAYHAIGPGRPRPDRHAPVVGVGRDRPVAVGASPARAASVGLEVDGRHVGAAHGDHRRGVDDQVRAGPPARPGDRAGPLTASRNGATAPW